MAKPKIAVIISTTRATRFGERPAKWIYDLASARADMNVELIDLREYPMPFFDEPASNAWVASKNEVAQRWQKKVAEFDGFIFTAAEYNHGPTAVLKNAIDYAANEWNKKPAGFVGYGSVGGSRAVEQLRLHAVELQMAPVKSAVHIAWGDFLAVRQGEKKLEDLEHLNQAAAALVNDVAWWAKVLKTARMADAIAGEAKAA